MYLRYFIDHEYSYELYDFIFFFKCSSFHNILLNFVYSFNNFYNKFFNKNIFNGKFFNYIFLQMNYSKLYNCITL